MHTVGARAMKIKRYRAYSCGCCGGHEYSAEDGIDTPDGPSANSLVCDAADVAKLEACR